MCMPDAKSYSELLPQLTLFRWCLGANSVATVARSDMGIVAVNPLFSCALTQPFISSI